MQTKQLFYCIYREVDLWGPWVIKFLHGFVEMILLLLFPSVMIPPLWPVRVCALSHLSSVFRMSCGHPGPAFIPPWQNACEGRQRAGGPEGPAVTAASARSDVGRSLSPTAFALVCRQRPMGRLPLQNQVPGEMDGAGQFFGASETRG